MLKKPNIEERHDRWKERVIINIIYDLTKNSIRLIRYSETQIYQLDELFLYLPAKTEGAVYCRLVDTELNECIVKLNKIKRESNYDVYQITLDNHITVQPGVCHLYFLIIQNNKIKSAKIENMKINFDNFSTANKLFLLDKNMKEMKAYVSQIAEYTKLNIQLYKDIREAVGLND